MALLLFVGATLGFNSSTFPALAQYRAQATKLGEHRTLEIRLQLSKKKKKKKEKQKEKERRRERDYVRTCRFLHRLVKSNFFLVAIVYC